MADRNAATRDAFEAGVRQAVTWLRADYEYGAGPDWREQGCEWIAERLAEWRVYVSATFAYTDDSTITVREVLFGLSPAVLIEPDVDEDARRFGFNVAAVDLDVDDLVTILRLCADQIEEAAARAEADDA